MQTRQHLAPGELTQSAMSVLDSLDAEECNCYAVFALDLHAAGVIPEQIRADLQGIDRAYRSRLQKGDLENNLAKWSAFAESGAEVLSSQSSNYDSGKLILSFFRSLNNLFGFDGVGPLSSIERDQYLANLSSGGINPDFCRSVWRRFSEMSGEPQHKAFVDAIDPLFASKLHFSVYDSSHAVLGNSTVAELFKGPDESVIEQRALLDAYSEVAERLRQERKQFLERIGPAAKAPTLEELVASERALRNKRESNREEIRERGVKQEIQQSQQSLNVLAGLIAKDDPGLGAKLRFLGKAVTEITEAFNQLNEASELGVSTGTAITALQAFGRPVGTGQISSDLPQMRSSAQLSTCRSRAVLFLSNEVVRICFPSGLNCVLRS